jgi:hypothetical protein
MEYRLSQTQRPPLPTLEKWISIAFEAVPRRTRLSGMRACKSTGTTGLRRLWLSRIFDNCIARVCPKPPRQDLSGGGPYISGAMMSVHGKYMSACPACCLSCYLASSASSSSRHIHKNLDYIAEAKMKVTALENGKCTCTGTTPSSPGGYIPRAAHTYIRTPGTFNSQAAH